MDYFKATYDETDGTIIITSNTYWALNANGNFMVSKYSGKGNSTLFVYAPEDIQYENGSIYFSYGSNNCLVSPPIKLTFVENKNYFSINPSYAVFHGKGSVATITVNSSNGYIITNSNPSIFRTIEYGRNKLMIISNTNDEFGIKKNKYIELRNVSSGAKRQINIYQLSSQEDEYTSILSASYSMIDNNTFSIFVTSLYKNVYNFFTWEAPEGVNITRQNNNNLIAKVENNETVGNVFEIIFKNDYTTYSLIINRDTGYQSSVFDVAIECPKKFTVDGGTLKLSVLSQTVDNMYQRQKLIDDNQKISNGC